MESVEISFKKFRDEDFEGHIAADRWMFGVSFTMLLGILVMVVKIAMSGS